MDSPRRRCYRCGRPSHLGYRCQAATRAPDAPASIWSTLVAPPAPVTAGAASRGVVTMQPPPAVDGGGLQLELTQQEAVVLTDPPPATNQSEDSMELTVSPSKISASGGTAPAASGSGQKRPLNTTQQSSSSSERSRSTSPKGIHSDTGFTVQDRSRGRAKKKRGGRRPRTGSPSPRRLLPLLRRRGLP